MKKYLYLILAAAAAGAVLSAILLMRHYYPDSIPLLSCQKGLENPCLVIAASHWSQIFGIPLAAFGLLFYVFLAFMAMTADYAGEQYHGYLALIALPLSLVSLVVDAGLIIILIKLGEWCHLCIMTYALNIIIAAASYLLYRALVREENFSLADAAKTILFAENKSSDLKAALAFFMLFTVILGYSIFSTVTIVKGKNEAKVPAAGEIKAFVDNFYRDREIPFTTEIKGMRAGRQDAPLVIRAFTDPLCSACYEFHNIEKYFLAKYKNKIAFEYYFFPLDKTCNKGMQRTVYPNSCVATRAFIAAGKTGIFGEYIITHFKHYKTFKQGYSKAGALWILSETIKEYGITVQPAEFETIMDSPESALIVEEHLKLAEDNKVNATPTLFMMGRKFEGFPAKEMLEAIITRELAQKGK